MIVDIYSITHTATISLMCAIFAIAMDFLEKVKNDFDFFNRCNINYWFITGLMGITSVLLLIIICMGCSLMERLKNASITDNEDEDEETDIRNSAEE